LHLYLSQPTQVPHGEYRLLIGKGFPAKYFNQQFIPAGHFQFTKDIGDMFINGHTANQQF
jgi:hypothetical protein